MNHLNSVLIEGCLVNDPALKQTAKGTDVCSFSVASYRFYMSYGGLEKEVSFFDVETWGKLAGYCRDSGYKGRCIRVVGRLKQERWNGDDGTLHARIFIVAEHVEFHPPKTEKGLTV